MYQEINDFVQGEGKSIYRFCCYLTRNQTEAEDLYQETFLTAVEKKDVLLKILHATEEQKENRSAQKYLMAVAANLWKNKKRKQSRHNRIAPVDDREEAVLEAVSSEGNPENDFLEKELCEEVRELVRQLPDKMQMAVYLYYMEQMSTTEIAEILRIPATSVRSRLSKARKRMRKELEERGYEKY